MCHNVQEREEGPTNGAINILRYKSLIVHNCREEQHLGLSQGQIV